MDDKEKRKLEVATHCRLMADQSFEDGDLSEACFHYINCLKMNPDLKDELKERFIYALSILSQQLERQKKYSDIFSYYQEGLRLFSESEVLQHNLGAHLLRLGCSDRAVFYFTESLKRNEYYFPAFRSLQSALCSLVERWHFRMLNDDYRNKMYKAAITRRVEEGYNTVLDIGTGTGLFCLFASMCGCTEVYGCEYNTAMTDIAEKVMEANDLTGKVKLIDEHSNDIQIPTHVNQRVKMLVTETFDAFLFGEQVLDALKYAWAELALTPPAAVSVPCAGRVYVAAVDSPQLARHYMHPMNGTAGRFGVRVSVEIDEPYDTERIRDVTKLRYVTGTHQLLQVNFNDPADIARLLNQRIELPLEWSCVESGYIHAFVAWFEIDLDEQTTLSSSPFSENAAQCCWEQAIFPLPRPIPVLAGGLIHFNAVWTNNAVSFDMKKVSYPDGKYKMFEEEYPSLPPSCLTMMNDRVLLDILEQQAGEFVKKKGHSNGLRLLDLYPIPYFSLAVFRLLNSTGNRVRWDDIKLITCVGSEAEEDGIRSLFDVIGVPADCVDIQTTKHFLEETISHMDAASLDVVVLNLIDYVGDLREDVIACVQEIKALLKENGILLPTEIQVFGQLINSEKIDRNLTVSNPEMSSLKIASHMNEYQTLQMLELNMATLKYTVCSERFECHSFALDALPTQFESLFEVKTFESSTNAILYWYRTLFGKRMHDSSHSLAYVHQAAYRIPHLKTFLANEIAQLRFVYHHGAFVVRLDDGVSLMRMLVQSVPKPVEHVAE